MAKTIRIELTAIQAKVLFNTIDGAADAGSCEGGCTKQELAAMQQISMKLLDKRADWSHVKLVAG